MRSAAAAGLGACTLFLSFAPQVHASAGAPADPPLAAMSAEGDAVAWRLRDRFRLFDHADPAARARVEAALEALAARPGDKASDAIRPHYDLLLATLAGPDADSLRRSNWRWSRTTESAEARRYERGYIYPQTYTIEARWPAGQGDCQWSVDGRPGPLAPCDTPVELSVNAGPHEGRWRGFGELGVTDGQGRATAVTVDIADRLVVAMGDSFSSGEGNPDVPSVISSAIPAGPEFERPDWLESEAARPWVERATWWDEPCHRSLLSWPVLASFWLASRDDRSAVTLVHVGCSGAEENDGLNIAQRKLPGGGDERASQADQVRSLLAEGPGRPIDNVLMSLGGNDVGFVPVIKYAVLPPNDYGLGPLDVLAALAVGGFGGAIPPYAERDALPLWAMGPWRRSAEERLDELPVRLARAADTFEDLGVAPDRVTHAAYPDILRNGQAEFCRTVLTTTMLEEHPADSPYRIRETAWRAAAPQNELGGFEALLTELPWFAKLRSNWNFQFQYYPDRGSEGCDPEVTSPEDSEVCKAHWVWTSLNSEVQRSRTERGWRVADAQITSARGHGWCVSPVDTLRMPVSERVDGGWRWSPEAPSAFQPYREDLGRWFRTTNDSVRTQWVSPDNMIGGTIHPTYNMHIAYAEAVADEAFRD